MKGGWGEMNQTIHVLWTWMWCTKLIYCKKKKKKLYLSKEAAKKILFLMAVPLKGEFTFRHIHFVLLPLLGD